MRSACRQPSCPGDMKALDRILCRDLWHLRGQVLAAALVVACGIASFVAMRGAYESLKSAQHRYYQDYRLADVFVRLKRAPESVAARIHSIPGVAVVATRVVLDVTLDVPGLAEPATARLVSVPDRQQPTLNGLFVRQGRYVEPGQRDEVLASEAFVGANGLKIGDRIGAVINGRWQSLRIVGVALSPEFVYEVGPGTILPDNKRFGVLWMARSTLGPAFNMDGAFNDVALALAVGASEKDVIDRLDELLAPYGGLAAHGRDEHVSSRYLADELAEIEISSTYIPAIFLGVAAFLVYIILSRLVSMQRTQIALLKAFGYSSARVGMHYLALALVTVGAGVVVGAGLGWFWGGRIVSLYRDYFHFPDLPFVVNPEVLAGTFLIGVAAAAAGALGTVGRVISLPPAEAMRPEPPAGFRAGVLELSGLAHWLPASARMIVRNVLRRRWKALLSIVGIALAVSILVVGRFLLDSVGYLVEVQFDVIERGDVTVLFNDPRSAAARFDIARLPGVLRSEPFRAVPARLRFEHRAKRVQITGFAPGGELHRLVDTQLRAVALPPDGLVLASKLARSLGVAPGDTVTVEVLEGARPVRQLKVAALVDELMGIGAYMDAAALARLMREDRNVSGAFLRVDRAQAPGLYSLLKRTPAVSGVAIRQARIDTFQETLRRSIVIASLINIAFACVIAAGIVYNGARIALSERANELASLRVLGFHEREIAAILLGEQALLTAVAIPVGWAIGYALCWLLVPVFDREFFRLPLVVERATFAYAFLVVAFAALLSGLLVARRLRRLDLVAVLKTRE